MNLNSCVYNAIKIIVANNDFATETMIATACFSSDLFPVKIFNGNQITFDGWLVYFDTCTVKYNAGF